MIDVGPDFRQQMLANDVDTLDAVLLTHEHNDHVIGLDDLRPLIFKRREAMKIYGEGRVLDEIRRRFSYAFKVNPYPGAPAFELMEIGHGSTFQIGNLHFEAVRILHGNLPILGFRCGDFAYLTDVSRIPKETMDRLGHLSWVVISALRHKKHHAHLSLDEAIEYVQIMQAKRGVLIHMSHKMGPVSEWESALPENIIAGSDNFVINLD